MSAALRSRLTKGLGGEVYARLVTVLVQLAGVPIFLHAWGAPLYGEWLILAAIPWYLTMSDAGFARAGTNEMTMLVARDERAVLFNCATGLKYPLPPVTGRLDCHAPIDYAAL